MTAYTVGPCGCPWITLGGAAARMKETTDLLFHLQGCAMAAAETIALEAVALADQVGGHNLVAAVAALAEAGLLRRLVDANPADILEGLLDYLWDCDLLGAPVTADGGGAG